MVKLKKRLKDDPELKEGEESKGRKYDPEFAKKPGCVRISEVALGMQLAIVAITDEEEGTLAKIGKGNPWHIHAMELVTGSTKNAFKKLSEILPEHFGLTLDRAFSHTKVLGSGNAVDTQGYIAHNDNDVVLAYRCTIGGFDWLTNFSASSSEFEPEEDAEQGHSGFWSFLEGRCCGNKGRVHTGFYNGFLVSQKDVEELLEPYIKGSTEPKRFFVVGHSLGAGIATVAYAYLLLKYKWELHPHKLILVTAGGPRVVDELLANQIMNRVKELRSDDKACIARIVRDDDVVPQVPPGFMGFRHLQKLVYVDKHGELMINPAIAGSDHEEEDDLKIEEPPSAVEEMKDLAEQVFDHEAYKQVLSMIPGRFVDHMPDMYLDPLMVMLAKTEPLQLEIIAARGLRDADWFGKSDPYVHVKLKGKSELCAKTHHVNGSLEPVWDFVTPVHNYEEGDVLEFEVYDKNLGMKDDFLGRASLEGSRFHKWGWEGELQLSDTGHKGESFIRVRASWRQKGKLKKA